MFFDPPRLFADFRQNSYRKSRWLHLLIIFVFYHIQDLVSRCTHLKDLDLEFTRTSNMAVISIIENCQNLVKLKLPEPDRESQIDFYIFEALSVLPKLEYLWVKLDENIDIEAEEILIAVLPHLIINPEWIQTPAIKGGLNSEGIFTLVQSSKKCANSLSYYVAHHKPTTNHESTNLQILNFFVYFIFKVAVEKRRSTLDHPRISF